ncbi:MAG: hypothetical protein HFJ44_04865 [Clostridia bacterium]|nr:hypothetical protein [Clostridia bacterium]MCI8964932.1 hypothetical protein [Clostridia bacterium]
MKKNLKDVIEMINGIDKKVVKLIKIGVNISYIVCLIGIAALIIEYKMNISLEFMKIGISIFKLGIIIALGFVIIGGGLGILKKMSEN